MVSKSVSTGPYGKWEIIVQQTSQSQSGNTSRVRVRGVLHKIGPGTSFNNGNIVKQIRGEDSWDGSGPISVGGDSSSTVIDQSFTVPHSSTGYKTVTYSVNLGDTGTSAFGNPPTVEVSLALTRIPKDPGAPGKPSQSFSAPRTIKYSWGAAATNGASILEYQLQIDNNSGFPSATSYSAGTARSKTFTAQGVGYRIYARVRARNSSGWGPYSTSTYYDIPDEPGVPSGLSLVYTPATTVKASWSAASGDGVSIVRYEMQYADNSGFSGAKLVKTSNGSTRTLTVSDCDVGKTWYFRVRAVTSQGTGNFSSAKSVLVVCGPRIRFDGQYRNTIAYVKYNGVWKVAVPYVRDSTWKVAGG